MRSSTSIADWTAAASQYAWTRPAKCILGANPRSMSEKRDRAISRRSERIMASRRVKKSRSLGGGGGGEGGEEGDKNGGAKAEAGLSGSAGVYGEDLPRSGSRGLATAAWGGGVGEAGGGVAGLRRPPGGEGVVVGGRHVQGRFIPCLTDP